MTQVQTFEFASALKLRAVEIDGAPWFVAKDVCDVLATRTDNLKAILDDDEIKPLQNSGLRGRAPLIVSESGMYALVLKSRKPEAKAFRRWVTWRSCLRFASVGST